MVIVRLRRPDSARAALERTVSIRKPFAELRFAIPPRDENGFQALEKVRRRGKSTLLRSLGLAHLMMQAGMFTGARSFRAGVCTGVFTHYN
jgi:hypothetical protein